MDWFITDILLYGKDATTRHIELKQGVNIITGDSNTGKSSIISIVDYCLGSSSREVPVRDIRDYTSWYAIKIQISETQIFLARKEPGPGKKSSVTMHMMIGKDIAIPSINDLTGKYNVDAIVNELSTQLGMMDNSLSVSSSSNEDFMAEPPTIRSVAPFLYQPQNIIANKDALFFKTDKNVDSNEARRIRVKKVIPYILGFIDAEYFILKTELDSIRRSLRALEHSLKEQSSFVGNSLLMAQSLWNQAKAVGLGSNMR